MTAVNTSSYTHRPRYIVLIHVPDKTLFPCQFYPGQSHMPGPSSLLRVKKMYQGNVYFTVLLYFNILNPTEACSLTCSWAAFLWSLEHMRGNISTGRCARLSWGISETTREARIQEDGLTGVETQKTNILYIYIYTIFNCPASAFLWLGLIDPCSN